MHLLLQNRKILTDTIPICSFARNLMHALISFMARSSLLYLKSVIRERSCPRAFS